MHPKQQFNPLHYTIHHMGVIFKQAVREANSNKRRIRQRPKGSKRVDTAIQRKKTDFVQLFVQWYEGLCNCKRLKLRACLTHSSYSNDNSMAGADGWGRGGLAQKRMLGNIPSVK